MARTVRDTKLESRQARMKLTVGKEPYWRSIEKGLHLGYYKGSLGGSWIARFRNQEKVYIKTTLGKADDTLDSDSVSVISYNEAQQKAREWYAEQSQLEAGIHSKAPQTVSQAADEYLAWFKANKKSYDFTKQSIELYVKPRLGKFELAKLSTRQIEKWREEIATSKARVRRKIDGDEKFRTRKSNHTQRKSTANRQLNILKAILNFAYRNGYISTDLAWRRVKPYHGVDQAATRCLSEAECKRLVNACDNDFRKLVQAALLSGCRYGELIQLKVADYNSDSGTIYIRETKSGKPRHVVLTDEGVRFFNHHTAGKTASATLFVKDDSQPWGKSHQMRRLLDASKKASIAPAVSFHQLRHTYASQLALQGTPLQVIATQLGHSDTRICEKHYAHLSPNYVASTIRANLPNLADFKEDTSLVRLRN